MPELLAAADVVVIPQRRNGFTEAQVPAKLFEAMAMAKTIVASSVSDVPEILGEGEASPRGWIIPPQDSSALAETLGRIRCSPDEAQRRGEAAREFFVENASTEAISVRLRGLLSALT